MAISDEIKEQTVKLKDMTFKKKVSYIWEYYKFWILGVIALIVFLVVFIRDYRINSRPYYLNGVILDSYLALDQSVNISDEFAKANNVDTDTYQLYIDTGMSLRTGSADTVAIAFQERLVAEYVAADLDFVMGPIDVMEYAANCNSYGDITQLLPQDLLDELKDREYEFYTYDPAAIEQGRQKAAERDGIRYDVDEELMNAEPFIAGVYLDTCPYLNNLGQNGVYPVPEKPEDRIIFTIPANTTRPERAAEFLRFLIAK